MGFGEFLDEGKSETAPAACSGAIVVETHETTPDQFPAAGGDPRPVVGDGDVRMTILAGKSHLDGAAGVLEGVVDEVGHHPGKLRLVARYHRVLDPPSGRRYRQRFRERPPRSSATHHCRTGSTHDHLHGQHARQLPVHLSYARPRADGHARSLHRPVNNPSDHKHQVFQGAEAGEDDAER
jgi:hypothetical protein